MEANLVYLLRSEPIQQQDTWLRTDALHLSFFRSICKLPILGWKKRMAEINWRFLFESGTNARDAIEYFRAIMAPRHNDFFFSYSPARPTVPHGSWRVEKFFHLPSLMVLSGIWNICGSNHGKSINSPPLYPATSRAGNSVLSLSKMRFCVELEWE
jgi:hypothetical protein